LQAALGLDELPVRIEGLNISNIGSEHTVASMVVFEGGATKKAHYRRFKVRGDGNSSETERGTRNGENGARGGPDDVASMEEVLTRRMKRYLEQADLSPHDAVR